MSDMVVYWCDENITPNVEIFPDGPTQLKDVLDFCLELRNSGALFVNSCSHSSESGGIVRDGKLPNGQPYTWKKRRP